MLVTEISAADFMVSVIWDRKFDMEVWPNMEIPVLVSRCAERPPLDLKRLNQMNCLVFFLLTSIYSFLSLKDTHGRGRSAIPNFALFHNENTTVQRTRHIGGSIER